MKTLHKLKTIQPYFDFVWYGLKTFEVRLNDRKFTTGDNVLLQEYDAKNKTYTGRAVLGSITYMLVDYPNVEKGYVVFSFKIIEKQTKYKNYE